MRLLTDVKILAGPCRTTATSVRSDCHPRKTVTRSHNELLPSSSRRAALLSVGVAGAALFGAHTARAVDIVMVSPEVAEALQQRDEALAFKCRGGMMDCDGDRRDYAKQQMENFRSRGTDDYKADCKREESCREPPKDLGEATLRMFADIQNAELGMSSDTKMNKMGIDTTRPNVIAMP